MSKPHLLSSAESAALAAKLCHVQSVSYYHTPFVSDVVNSLRKIHSCAFLETDSFSSAVNAAMGGSLGGHRSLAVSSLPRTAEDVAIASYTRLPITIINVSRPLGTFSIKQDHSDILSLRDAGCLIFMPENNIDLMESVIQAYKVAEDPKVMLPAVVNIDLPNYSETFVAYNDLFVRRYLGNYKHPVNMERKPAYVALPDDNYSDFKKQQHKSMKNAVDVLEKTSLDWKKKFKRTMPMVELYKTDDADMILVMSGYHSTTAKAAVDSMRKQGKKVGLLRIRVVRPWPGEAIKTALANAKKVAVYDQAVSIGVSGMFYQGIRPLAGFCSDFIALGKYPEEKDFAEIFSRLEKSQKEEAVWL